MRRHLEAAYLQGCTAARGQNTDMYNISDISALTYSICYPPMYVAGVLCLAISILVINRYWKPPMGQTLSWVLRKLYQMTR